MFRFLASGYGYSTWCRCHFTLDECNQRDLREHGGLSLLQCHGSVKTWPWVIWTRVLETWGCYIVNYLVVTLECFTQSLLNWDC
jgi:hypothetical protein